MDKTIKQQMDAFLEQRSKQANTKRENQSEKQAAQYMFYQAFKVRRDEVILPALNELLATLKDSGINHKISAGDSGITVIFSENAIITGEVESFKLPSVRIMPDVENFQVLVLENTRAPDRRYALDDVSPLLIQSLTLDLLKRAFASAPH